MSPTVLRKKGYRLFFFSREEARMRIHVNSPDGEAKFWLDPTVELAKNYRYSARQIKEIQEIIEDQYHDLVSAWRRHFGG